jgi:hypothetical protein
MFEGLGATLASWGQGAGNWMQQNPEQFAIMADMIGKNLAPNNAFAGVGGMMGQSSLANHAAAAQQKERQEMLKMLMPLLGGESGGATQQEALDPNGQTMAPASMFDTGQGNTPVGVPNVTAPSAGGPTSVTYKAGNDSNVTQSIVSNSTGKKPATGVNLSDLLPLLLAQSGKTPVDLTGLTPEQILGISRNDLALGQLNNQTVSTLFDNMYRKALAEAEAGKVDSYNANQYAQAEKSRMDALIKLREEIRNSDLHPLVKADKLAETDARIASASASRAGAQNSLANAGKTRQETGIEAERQAIMKNLPEGTTLEDLPLGAQMQMLGSSFQDYVSRKSGDEIKKTQAAFGALARSGDEEKRSPADVDEWNNNAPNEATFGLIWQGEEGIFWDDDPAPIQVALPDGYTMEDVRASAASRNMSVEEVLKLILQNDKGRK